MGLLGFFIDVTGRIVRPYYCPMIVSPEMDTAPCGLKACLLDQSYKRWLDLLRHMCALGTEFSTGFSEYAPCNLGSRR